MTTEEDAVDDHRSAYGNGAAAIRALGHYEPRDSGERIIVEAVRALARNVTGIDRRVNQGFLDLRAHLDEAVEELRSGVAGVAATQGKLEASADSVAELLSIVRGLDAYVRGTPTDRPSSPETPSAKQRVSAVTAIGTEDNPEAGTGDDP